MVAPLGPLKNSGNIIRLVPRTAVAPTTWDSGAFDGAGFQFLGRRLPFQGDQRWDPPGAERLWVYQLHYFRYLWLLEPRAALGLVLDWIDQNPAPRGPGWEPYTLSLRVREWIEWLLWQEGLEQEPRDRIVASLALQAEALFRQIEHHLQGNHLLENAITLCWAGLSLESRSSAAWLHRGAALLGRELARQVLEDGVHEERSAMYQALLVDALLRLSVVAASATHSQGPPINDQSTNAGRKMLNALGDLTHPDGGFVLMNDCALGGAPEFDSLRSRWIAASGSRRIGAWTRSVAGFLGWRENNGNYLVLDAGPLGPDHQPGHGHADNLSFEMSLSGRRVFTDTGVLTYSEGPTRAYDRSTAAHNTVEIDGKDQSEVWASFRCGRRATPTDARVTQGAEWLELTGAYKGPGKSIRPVHHRRTITVHGSGLSFLDQLHASGRHSAALRLHLAPGISAKKTDEGVSISDGRRAVAMVRGDGLDWVIGASPYHPDFGVEEERDCLTARVSFEGQTRIGWRLCIDGAGG